MIKRKNKAILCAIASIALMNTSLLYSVNAMSNENSTIIQTRNITNMKVYNTSSLNIRKGPGTKYARIGTVYNNNILEVIEISNGWAKINYKNGIGYCSAKYLKTVSSSSSSTKKEMVVKVNDLSVRSGAGAKYNKLGSLNKGSKVTVISTLSNGWVKIEYKNGYGYVSNVKGAYLEVVSSSNPSVPGAPSTPDVPSTPDTTLTKYSANEAINLRKTASWKGEVITVIKKGVTFDVVSIDNGWAKANYNGKTGFVPASHITKLDLNSPSVPDSNPSTPDTTPSTKKEMIVKVDGLSVRTGSSTKYKKIGSLNKGNKVTIIEELSNGWVKIEFDNGYGYVSNIKGAYLEEVVENSQEKADKVIAMIDALNYNITLDDYEAVINAREAYNNLSQEEQTLVNNLIKLTNAEAQIESIMKRVREVIDLIDGLPAKIELIHEQQVIDVTTAFNNLSTDEQNRVPLPQRWVLESAEARINQLKKEQSDAVIVQDLIERIDKLKGQTINIKDHETEIKDIRAEYEDLEIIRQMEVTNYEEFLRIELDLTHIYEAIIYLEGLIMDLPETIERVHGAKVEEAKRRFEDLTAKNQIKVKPENVAKLQDAIAQADRLKEEIVNTNQEVKTLVADIKQLPIIEDITIDNKDQVFGLMARYRSLPDDVKFAVDTTTVEEAFDKIEGIMVEEVIILIDSLPSISNLDLTHATLLEEARTKYNEISSRNNTKVTNINVLTELEAKMLELESVNSVIIDIVNKIKDLDHTITFDNLDEILVKVDEIEALLETITDEEFDLITNLTKYEEVLIQIDILNRVNDVTTGAKVVDMINALPEVALIDFGHGDKLTDIRNAYAKISADEKLLVNNLDKLEEAEAEYKRVIDITNNIISAIHRIPEIDKLTINDEAKVNEAKELYYNAEEKVKHYVNHMNVGHLENALIKIEELKKS